VCLRILLLYNKQINTLITKSTFLFGSLVFVFLLRITLRDSLYLLLYLYLVSRDDYNNELTQTKYAQKSVYDASILILKIFLFVDILQQTAVVRMK